MMNLSKEEIIDRIIESKGLSREEILKRVEAKVKELEGIISEYGALCIVANELGVKLYKSKVTESPHVKLKNLISGLRRITVFGEVRNILPVKEFVTKDNRKGKLVSFLLNDGTSTRKVVLWNDKTDLAKGLKEGSVIKLENVDTKENNNFLEIHSNQNTILIENPDGFKLYNQQDGLNLKRIYDINSEGDFLVLGKLVSIFSSNPVYESCPECNKKLYYEDGKFKCKTHGVVEPNYSIMLRGLLDDGTGVVRVTFFNKSAEVLLGKSTQEIAEMFKKNPKYVFNMFNQLLGKDLVLRAKVTKNNLTGGLDVIAQRVYNPNYVRKAYALMNAM